MKKNILLLLFTLIILMSCNNTKSITEENKVQLRIKNNTSQILNNIFSNNISFGVINPNETSDYIDFNTIHAYPDISVTYNNETYNWSSPIDNIGFWSATFNEGKYTLSINSLIDNNNVEATIIKTNTNCDEQVIISQDLYINAPNNDIEINNISINNNCLTINYSASGCNGESWIIKLIDANEIMESNPIQRNIRVSFENNELCDAYFTNEISFDISQLQIAQIQGAQVILNITNTGESILYTYTN